MKKGFFDGYVQIRMKGENKERFLNMCRMKHIRMWDLRKEEKQNIGSVRGCEDDEKAFVMCMLGRDLLESKSAIKKSGIKVDVLQKSGLPFFIRRMKKRIVFVAGILICICFLVAMMQKIWCIQIEGNRKITDEELIEFLATQEVFIGTSISELSYEDLEFGIRGNFDDITWVSVVRRGTTLIVRVKENEFTDEVIVYEDPTDLIADYDGEILSMVVRQGVPLVKIGDTVAKGDILVQGAVPVFDENSEIVKYQYCYAQADIRIRTTQQYTQSLNRVHEVKVYGETVRNYQFGVGTKLLTVGRNCRNALVQTSKQMHQLVLFEYLYLPFYYNEIEYRPYEIVEEVYSREAAQELLYAELEKYLCELSEKGVQIVRKDVKIIENGLTMQIVADLTLDRSVGISTGTTVELIENDGEEDN